MTQLKWIRNGIRFLPDKPETKETKMDEFQLTDFPKLYSTNKKDVERFSAQVYEYAKRYGYITIRDFVRLWFNLREDRSNTYIQSASVQWCVEYKDLPKRHDIKKDKTKGWYLEMPAAYMF